MDILFLSHRLPFPANKGEKIRTFNQIKYLAELGHRITVFSPMDSDEDINNDKAFNQLNNITSYLFPSSSKAIRLLSGLLQGEAMSVANFRNTNLRREFERVVTEHKFDAIVCTSSAMAQYVFESQSLQGMSSRPRLLMDFMDLDSDKWRQYAERSRFPMSLVYDRERRLMSKYEQKAQQVFDACYFIADAEVQLFCEQLTSQEKVNNVFTLGNGLNTEEFYPASGKTPKLNDAPCFIFTGVMDYKPNVDAVIWFVDECWEQIRQQFPKAKFIIAGMNPTSEIQNLQSQSGIEVTGFVEEILPYYHQADYFVAAFRLARGVQNKVLQAFACGIPVVTTPMGAEGIDCEDGEHLLLANTGDEFVEKITKLQQDDSLCEHLTNNALSLIQQQFSWEGKLRPLRQQIEG